MLFGGKNELINKSYHKKEKGMQNTGYSYPEETVVSSFMYKVYGWMSFALAVTASVAYYLFKSQNLFFYLYTNPMMLFGIIILQFALVIALAFFLMRMSFTVALSAFVVYAATMGITTASIFFVYTQSSIFATFGVTAGMFAFMSLYGYFTKADLTAIGNIAFMGLIGIVIAMIVNMFLRSAAFDYFISAVGVLVFTALTAYDTQKIKQIASRLVVDSQTKGKIAIYGALTLYLDFINLFLFLLRFMGNRRES